MKQKPWAVSWVSLSFNFLIYKPGIRAALHTSQNCCKTIKWVNEIGSWPQKADPGPYEQVRLLRLRRPVPRSWQLGPHAVCGRERCQRRLSSCTSCTRAGSTQIPTRSTSLPTKAAVRQHRAVQRLASNLRPTAQLEIFNEAISAPQFTKSALLPFLLPMVVLRITENRLVLGSMNCTAPHKQQVLLWL